MPNPDRISVLTLIESATVTGPSRILLDFAAKAGSPEPDLPAIDLTVLTFHRGTGECTLAAAAQRVGVPAIVIPERGRWDPGVMGRLRRAVEEFNPDILESRNVKSHFFIRATGLHKRFPWIAWNHGYTSKDRLDRAYNKLDRWSLRGAFRVMTVCRPFADAIEAQGVPAGKISVLHNFVKPYTAATPEEKARLREQLGLGDDKVILTVGRMSAEKGHADLLEAIALLRNSPGFAGYRVLFVGDGPEQENLRQQAARLGISDRIVMPGFQRDVAPYYGMATIFALPSHSEGSPNVVLEAMSAGLPVVAASVGGVPEIVENGKTGILVPPRDPGAMADGLKHLLQSEDSRERMGAAAKQKAESAYTFEDYKRALTQFYVETLRMRNHSAEAATR
jgi:glycosyltransferase involved in cell wall biosynthesis